MSDDKRLSAAVYLFLLRTQGWWGYDDIMDALGYEASIQAIRRCLFDMERVHRVRKRTNGRGGRAARVEYSVDNDCMVPYGVKLGDLMTSGLCQVQLLETAT